MPIASFPPFSFLVLVSYCILLLTQCCFDSLELVWVFIELLTFVFIGIALTSSTGSFITYGVVSYFITQRMLSMVLLVRIFLFHMSPLFFVSSLIFGVTLGAKLGVFPFSGWYLSSVSFFPSFILLVALTFHKVPLLYMVNILIPSFLPSQVCILIYFLLVTNLVVMSFSSVSSLDLRSLLITTSIGNNSWLLLACVAGGWTLFFFLSVYSILLAFSFSRNTTISRASLLAVRGLPPSPLFFLKLVVMWTLCSQSPYSVTVIWLRFVILATLLLSYSYLRFVFRRFVTAY